MQCKNERCCNSGICGRLDLIWKKSKNLLKCCHAEISFPLSSPTIIVSNSLFLERHLQIAEREGSSQAWLCPFWPKTTAEVLQEQWNSEGCTTQSEQWKQNKSAFLMPACCISPQGVPTRGRRASHLSTSGSSLACLNCCFHGLFWHWRVLN